MAGWFLINRANKRAADLFLTGASLLFYAAAGWESFALFLVMMAVNYLLSLWMRRLRMSICTGVKTERNKAAAKVLLTAGILFNAGLLLYYKYTGFFIANYNLLTGADRAVPDLILPLGISFTSFTQISYLVDSYRGETEDVTLIEYLKFSTFFPKITQGPITRADQLIPQMRDERTRHFDAPAAAAGLQMFVLGLSKKLLLADPFGRLTDYIIQTVHISSSLEIIIAALAYTMQIYFDFSGYSDMALGAAGMLGFKLPVNFDSPYQADSITDFWRRWHISLTDFLRRYIYFPLGGSRKGKFRTYLNIIIVFLVSGFWHGASWTFVLWGLCHGICQVIERLLRKWLPKIPRIIRRIYTFIIVSALWLLFRCGDMSVLDEVRAHLHFHIWYLRDEVTAKIGLPGFQTILHALHIGCSESTANLISMLIYFAAAFVIVLVPKNVERREYRTNTGSLLTTLVLLVICLLSMSSVSTFIYNNF